MIVIVASCGADPTESTGGRLLLLGNPPEKDTKPDSLHQQIIPPISSLA